MLTRSRGAIGSMVQALTLLTVNYQLRVGCRRGCKGLVFLYSTRVLGLIVLEVTQASADEVLLGRR